jgi:hypothetical protein
MSSGNSFENDHTGLFCHVTKIEGERCCATTHTLSEGAEVAILMEIWAECRYLSVTSWLGRPLATGPTDVSFIYQSSPVPLDFADDFNATGPHAITRAIQADALLSAEARDVGPILFCCDGVPPAPVSQYAFLRPTGAQTLFYSCFSAANLDFMALTNAFHLLLPRVALPEDRSSLFVIFNAFADAYMHTNSYTGGTREDICKLAVAAVILSMTKTKDGSFSSGLYEIDRPCGVRR